MSFDATSTASEVVAGHDLTGMDAVVTGGASGLGAETARALASAGARVTLAVRDAGRGRTVARRIAAETGNPQVVHAELDLASLASVRAFTGRWLDAGRPLHLLINNAGVMATPLTRTADGFESQFGTNHIGHFALTTGLRPALRAAGRARVVVLSSRAHRRGDVDFDDPNYRRRPYDPWEAYGQSKSANALFAVGLTGRWADDGVTSNALMPGAIMTDLQRHLPADELIDMGWADADGNPVIPPGWKTVEQGAATTVWAAVAPELDGIGGRYLDNCAIARPWTEAGDPPSGHYLPRILDPDRADRLWTLSEKLIAD
ncbi:SDR family NAD(P)-dependent oxidoreductase [Actinomadura rupiterrae]|uniref:SDR family NAD(P)-dependent oxidoreductase n=1 Tax=Actinomadura rupiterrae TaxID=559627 RepID=UPI0020A42BA4|nr:SDR family NAD(P)-dependent oxidoreductase [Actinomadura rupiterrae]MCP2339924.1 NAD(P)-dependent dehydrogenase (short-subunit alcohol dehydrogenase family) [Actinomadura rupiterrae]